jgi:hypothetical protein
MKNLLGWIALAALFAPVALSMASPPVTAPPGLAFTTETLIEVDGTVSESEQYSWQYSEGKGNFGAATGGTDAEGHSIIISPGVQAAAAINYRHDYSAINGQTSLYRKLTLDPNQAPNLSALTIINFDGDPFAGSSMASHKEEVGLAMISAGAQGAAGNIGSSLLSLCPWATIDSGINSGYPASSARIAAGSSFKVTNIQGFVSESTVISTEAPLFQYSVITLSGEGFIDSWSVVELWEGTGRWGSHDTGIHEVGRVPTGTYALDKPPGVASRTSYSENASADGAWTFRKSMSYRGISKYDPIYFVP